MTKLNRKIIDYIALGTIGAGSFIGTGWAANDILQNNKITKKSLHLIEASLGSMTLGMGYATYRLIKEDYDKRKLMKEGENNEGELEEGVKK